MMKNMLGWTTTVGSVVLTLLLCGSSRAEGITYTDRFSGITVKLPEGWEQLSLEGLSNPVFQKGCLLASFTHVRDASVALSAYAGNNPTAKAWVAQLDSSMIEKGEKLEISHRGSVIVDEIKGYGETYLYRTPENSKGSPMRHIAFITDAYKGSVFLLMFASVYGREFSSEDKVNMEEFLSGVNFHDNDEEEE